MNCDTATVEQWQATLNIMEAALNGVSDAVVWVDDHQHIQGCNAAFEGIVERSRSLLIGTPLHDILPLHQSGHPIALDAYPDIRLRRGELISDDYEFRLNSAQPHDFHSSLILRISGNLIDVGQGRSTILAIRIVAPGQLSQCQDAEQQREETLSLLRATLESTGDGILVVNWARNAPVYNQKFLQMWSVPEELMLPGREDERLAFLANQTVDPEAFTAAVWDLFLNHPEDSVLDMVEFKDGRVFERYSQPQWRGDRIIGRVWSFRDITARKQAEASLRHNESKFRNLFENSQVGIYRVRLGDGLILDANQRLVELTGYESANDLIGKKTTAEFYVDAADRQWVLEQVQQHGYLKDYELQFRKRDGSICWGLCSVRLIAGAECIEGVITDITDRKQAEEALRASEAQYRDLVQTANCIILRWDTNGTIKFINEYGQRLLGFDSHELLDRNVVGTIVPQTETSGRDLETLMIDICQHPERHLFNENENCCKNGDRVWIVWANKPIFNAQGQLIEILSVGTDATKRKRTEEALRRSELKYRNIFENSQVGIGRTRVNSGLFLDANQRCAEIMGHRSASDLIGKRFSIDFYANPSDRQHMLTELQQHGEVRDFEFAIRQPNGTIRWSLMSLRLNTAEDCIDFVVADISDRKQLEEELLNSQRFLDSIIDNIPLALFAKEVNNDFRYALINKSSEKILGFSRDGAIGRNDHELLPKEQADFHHAEDLAALAHGSLIEISEQWIGSNDHERIMVRGWKIPLFDSSGHPSHILAISEDVTERKQREQALRLIMEGTAAKTGDDFFRACVRSLAEVLRVRYALVTKLVDGTQTTVRTLSFWDGNAFGDNFEYSPQGTPCERVFQGQTCYYPEGLRSRFAEDLDLLAIGAESYLGVPLTNSAGAILGHLAVLDVQPMNDDPGRELILKIFAARAGAELERKQAEESLHRRAEIDSLLSSISRQFIDQEVNTAIAFTLEAIAHLIGAEHTCIFEYSDNQQQFSLIHEWHTANTRSLSLQPTGAPIELYAWLHRQILSGNVIQVACVDHLPAEAIAERTLFKSRLIQSIVTVPVTHSGKVVGFISADAVHFSKAWTPEEVSLLKLAGELIAIGRARHQAEAALRVAKEAAEAANRAKSAFLANMSHELRTPLNAILGFSQLMERDTALTSRQRESLSIINRSGEHLLNLINDVLEMSKIEAGRITLNPSAFDLHQLLSSIRDLFHIRTEAKQLALDFTIAEDLPQYVLTDEGKLRQVLINLLGNAVKFTSAGGIRLEVSVEPQPMEDADQRIDSDPLSSDVTPYRLHFSVSDTGRGIAPEEIDQLFQPFVQTASGTQIKEGTGLGLTISRQFVRLMGGDIHLTSTVGQGSTFWFTVPVFSAHPVDTALPTVKRRVLGLAPHQPTYRILIVDDRAENCQLMTQLLTVIGFETRTASNGQEAIAQWQTWHPHLIWMDMRMPVLDGYDATRQIRQLEKTTPTPVRSVIIALTASAFEEQQASIIAAGCDDFVRKPFREDVIFDKMIEHLRVEFVYDAEDINDRSQDTSSTPSTPPSQAILLKSMSPDWIAALHQAALEVDGDRILTLIDQLPNTHSVLAEQLSYMVQHFCFDELLELTQTHPEQ